MCLQEVEGAVKKNECFSIEIMEDLPRIVRFDSHSKINAQDLVSHLRVFMECLIKLHFG